LEHTLATYMYSHSNICNIQMKQPKHLENTLATYIYSHYNIRNIKINTYTTSKINIRNIHLKHICRREARCPQSPVTRAANDSYRCGPMLLSRTPRAGHTRGKDRCNSHMTATARAFFFWLSRCAGRGPSVWKHYRSNKDLCSTVYCVGAAARLFMVQISMLYLYVHSCCWSQTGRKRLQ
jgi:hypothetical protein